MGNFYLDIETTGLDPKTSKIVTIQFQELERNSGRRKGELVILKEWESSEKQIVKEFAEVYGDGTTDKWKFIPSGFNLGFEHNFLRHKAEQYYLPPLDILNRPFIDLHSVAILMNRGEFKGSGLDKVSKKSGSGKDIPIWYENKQYDRIIKYVQDEAKSFIELHADLYEELPKIREKIN